jgi:hypothetical protein
MQKFVTIVVALVIACMLLTAGVSNAQAHAEKESSWAIMKTDIKDVLCAMGGGAYDSIECCVRATLGLPPRKSWEALVREEQRQEQARLINKMMGLPADFDEKTVPKREKFGAEAVRKSLDLKEDLPLFKTDETSRIPLSLDDPLMNRLWFRVLVRVLGAALGFCSAYLTLKTKPPYYGNKTEAWISGLLLLLFGAGMVLAILMGLSWCYPPDITAYVAIPNLVAIVISLGVWWRWGNWRR